MSGQKTWLENVSQDFAVGDRGTAGCDPCACGHPWSEHTDPRYQFGTGCLEYGCPCTKFDPKFKNAHRHVIADRVRR